jgi:hypothetical protein
MPGPLDNATIRSACMRASAAHFYRGGIAHNAPTSDELVCQITVEALEELADLLAFVLPTKGGPCACPGNVTIELLAGDERVALMAIHHGTLLQLDGWTVQPKLRYRHRLIEWCVARGVPATLFDPYVEPMYGGHSLPPPGMVMVTPRKISSEERGVEALTGCVAVVADVPDARLSELFASGDSLISGDRQSVLCFAADQPPRQLHRVAHGPGTHDVTAGEGHVIIVDRPYDEIIAIDLKSGANKRMQGPARQPCHAMPQNRKLYWIDSPQVPHPLHGAPQYVAEPTVCVASLDDGALLGSLRLERDLGLCTIDYEGITFANTTQQATELWRLSLSLDRPPEKLGSYAFRAGWWATGAQDELGYLYSRFMGTTIWEVPRKRAGEPRAIFQAKHQLDGLAHLDGKLYATQRTNEDHPCVRELLEIDPRTGEHTALVRYSAPAFDRPAIAKRGEQICWTSEGVIFAWTAS